MADVVRTIEHGRIIIDVQYIDDDVDGGQNALCSFNMSDDEEVDPRRVLAVQRPVRVDLTAAREIQRLRQTLMIEQGKVHYFLHTFPLSVVNFMYFDSIQLSIHLLQFIELILKYYI